MLILMVKSLVVRDTPRVSQLKLPPLSYHECALAAGRLC